MIHGDQVPTRRDDCLDLHDDERRIAEPIDLARALVSTAGSRPSGRRDRARRRRFRALVRDPAAADFTVRLTDEVPRIPDASTAARRFADVVHRADLRGLGGGDRLLLLVAARVAPLLPSVVMPMVLRRLRAEASTVIVPAEEPAFSAHLQHRRTLGMRPNVNVLGEAIVGDDEARRRLDRVVDRIRRPDVDHVSVKLSAICADVSPIGFEATLARVTDRLRVLFDAASSAEPVTFVNLDMEEYRDLHLTVAAFRTVLDEPRFHHLEAGLVLQAYLPDAQGVARDLAGWAAARVARGGGRIKVRLVKGANLAMESVEAELHGWLPATYGSKHEVDANYKAVLDVLCDPAYDDAVRVGVASHNLFDVAWALGLDAEHRAAGRPSRLVIEMLEGMAPSQADAVRELAGTVLLYTPVVDRHDFPSAIAYLVRRLDENTTTENFLAHLDDLADDPAAFDDQARRFAAAVRARRDVTTGRRRPTRRLDAAPTSVPALGAPFVNAADTDWTDASHREQLAVELERVRDHGVRGASTQERRRPPSVDDVDRVVSVAVAARSGWAATTAGERAALIHRVADEIESRRGRILAVMARHASKTVAEGDPEISEAVDFARYYARSALGLDEVRGARPESLGPVVVAPPWNFPFAIPAGGVLAALAAGNPVVLKPAPQTREVAALVAECCWAAGLDRDVLQLLPTDDDAAGRRLVTHPDVGAVILTGAHDTARTFLGWRPDLRLHAETSGKNALLITACADVDRAVVDLVRSAFGHAGQKCSAASLAIVEASRYDDAAFLERIRDAAATLRVGPAEDPSTDVAPLVDPPGERLTRALTRLEPGETWLLRPECRSDDRRSWSPGIRVGVRPGSWFARTECFGPVLGIVRARDLDEAISIQNDVEFGLTAGLHSLDPDEIERWTDRVEAGNLYVNRGITGAIVQRQPFGGWKRSAVGPTAKAGGPNYVATLCRWRDEGQPIDDAVEAYQRWMRDVGTVEHDPTGLTAERNVLRYRPLPGGVLVRYGPDATSRERRLLAAAAVATGARLVVSDAVDESAATLASRIRSAGVQRLRLVGEGADGPEHVVRRTAHAAGIVVDDAAPVGAPEIELPRWLREQSVTTTLHRHGRVTR